MADVQWDVVVIGGGPAGSRSAELLAKSGRRVLLVEAGEEGREKTCGGLLNRDAQSFLTSSDYADEEGRPQGLPASIRIGANTPKLEFPDLEFHDLDNSIRAVYDPHYRNIDRKAFDAWLLGRAVDAGAQVSFNTRATNLDIHQDRIEVSFKEHRITSHYVVDASGSAAFSRKALGGPVVGRLNSIQGSIKLDPIPQNLWAIYKTGYTPFFSWIIPKEDGRCLIGTALTDEGIKREKEIHGGTGWELLSPMFEYLARRGYRFEKLEDRPHGSVLTNSRNKNELWFGTDRVIAIGEASGFVSPFSGEGISYALGCALGVQFMINANMDASYMARIVPNLLEKMDKAWFKALIGAIPFLRPWSLWFLPIVTGSKLKYIPFKDGFRAED